MDDCTVRIELLRGVSAVIRKFLDEVFVPVSKLVLWAVLDGERLRAEVLQQVFEQAIR